MKANLLVVLALGAGLLSSPAFAQRKKKNMQIFEIEGKVPGEPSKLPIHDKYVGKIMFSDQQLTLDNTSESMFKSSFNLGDNIYARVFTSNAVENYMLYENTNGVGQPKVMARENLRYSYTIYYFIDSVQIKEWEQNNKGNLQGVNTWQRMVMLDPKSGQSYDLSSDRQREALNKLSPGVHKVKVEIWGGEGKNLATIKPIAEGTFDLNVMANSKIKIGKTWAGISDGKIDQAIKTDVINLYAPDVKKNYPGLTFKEFKVPSNDYAIQKDEYGRIRFRFVQAYAYAMDKNGKCFTYSCLYVQNYAGAGTYSPVFSKWGHDNIEEVDCE